MTCTLCTKLVRILFLVKTDVVVPVINSSHVAVHNIIITEAFRLFVYQLVKKLTLCRSMADGNDLCS